MATADPESQSRPAPAQQSTADASSHATHQPVGNRPRLRTWLACGLAVCWPGAGHLSLGEWARGCSWALLCGASLVVLSAGTPLVVSSLPAPFPLAVLYGTPHRFADVAMPLAVLGCSVLDCTIRATLAAPDE